MVASVAVSFLSVWAFASVGAMLTCKSNVSEIRRLSDGGCMYILEKSDSDYKDVFEAECRSLNNETNEWRLPTIKTKAKNDEVEKMLEATVQKQSWFWIGVVREADDPKGNKTEWGDLTKWRWSLDNTTVAEAMGNFTPKYSLSGGTAPVQEHCVFAFFDSEFKWGKNPLWYDAPCSKGWKVTGGFGKPLLLCESAGVVTTSTSSTSTSTTTKSTTTTSTTTTTMPATTTTTTTTKRTSSTSTSPSTPVAPKRWKPWQIGLAVLIVVDVIFMIAVAVIFICTGKPPKYKSLDDTPREERQRVESNRSAPSKPAVKKPGLKLKGKKKA